MTELEQFIAYFDKKYDDYQNFLEQKFTEIDKQFEDLNERLTQTIKY